MWASTSKQADNYETVSNCNNCFNDVMSITINCALKYQIQLTIVQSFRWFYPKQNIIKLKFGQNVHKGICSNTRKNPHQSGPRFTMADTVLVQNVNSIKMTSVTPHLKDNLMQNHIFIRKIPQMGNFPNYDLKMIKRSGASSK